MKIQTKNCTEIFTAGTLTLFSTGIIEPPFRVRIGSSSKCLVQDLSSQQAISLSRSIFEALDKAIDNAEAATLLEK